MSETKFTPGPWKIYRGAHGFQLLGIGGKNGEGVTDSYLNLWGGHDDEAEANAHLISCAPEMYEALTEIVGQYTAAIEIGSEALTVEYLAVLAERRVTSIQKARAALQRARGEA